MISQEPQESIQVFLDKMEFVRELEKAMTEYFTSSPNIHTGVNVSVEIYDWRLVAVVVRDSSNVTKRNQILLFAQEDLAQDKSNRLFTPVERKEVSGTNFYSQIMEIPSGHQHSIGHDCKYYLTATMKQLLVEMLNPTNREEAELNLTKLLDGILKELDEKWVCLRFKVTKKFSILP